MKVLYVVESLSRKGGAENALVNLCIELVKIGHKPSIIYLWGPNDFHVELNARGIKMYNPYINLSTLLNCSSVGIISPKKFLIGIQGHPDALTLVDQRRGFCVDCSPHSHRAILRRYMLPLD